MSKQHEYTGEIRRANVDGSEIAGFLVDNLGYRIELRGHKDKRRGHGYFVYGYTQLDRETRRPAPGMADALAQEPDPLPVGRGEAAAPGSEAPAAGDAAGEC